MPKEYVLSTASDLGYQQLDHLVALLDDKSKAFLSEVGVESGHQCFDLGAGGGSIASWLAERTGPTGNVVAVDLDTELLEKHPQLEVLTHDINDGMPDDRTYDLIHVRLVLMHLTRRREILRDLVAALRPGGWLVISDFGDRPRHVVSAPDKESQAIFERVQELAHDMVRNAGISYKWAHDKSQVMEDVGLQDVYSAEWSWTTRGGTDGTLLHRNVILQLRESLVEKTELTADEVEQYCELMRDPKFRAWFYQFVYTRGRKPLA